MVNPDGTLNPNGLVNLGTGEGLYEVRFLGNQIILFHFSIFRKIPRSDVFIFG